MSRGRKLFEENLINPAVLVNPLRVSFEYDEAGNRRRTLWPDGYSAYYTYDALNRMEYAREK